MNKILSMSALILIIASLTCQASRERKYVYYREIADSNAREQYETVIERRQRCMYIGNNHFQTSDGNVWEFENGNEYKLHKKYYIYICNEATEYIEDDVVVGVSKW